MSYSYGETLNDKSTWDNYKIIDQMKVINLWKLMQKENKSEKEKDMEMNITLELDRTNIDFLCIPLDILHRFTNTK